MFRSMPVPAVAVLAAFMLSSLTVIAQPQRDAKAILQSAAGKLDSIGSVRFHARIIFQSLDSDEPDTSGVTALIAHSADVPGGALVRLDYDDSTVAAFDGVYGYYLDPRRKVISLQDTSLHPESNIGSDLLSLFSGSAMRKRVETSATINYEGSNSVRGARYDSLLMTFPDRGDVSNARRIFCVDAITGTPTRSISSLQIYGRTQLRSIELDRVELNPRWSRELFTVDTTKADSVVHHTNTPPPPPIPPLAVGEKAPAWRLVDGNGDSVALADFRGRIVVLDFWGTWCGWCKIVMPDVQRLHTVFKDEPVDVIGMAVENSPTADPKGFMEKKGCTYRLVIGDHKVAQEYHVTGYPTLFIIGTDGRIAYVSGGADPNGHMKNEEEIVRKLLKSTGTSR